MSDGAPQGNAADAFASRAQAAHDEAICELVVFGNAARGDDRGVHATVEVLLVVEAADPEIERQLESLAETVGLEYGVVFSVHVLPADRFEAQSDHPFIRSALDEGSSYV